MFVIWLLFGCPQREEADPCPNGVCSASCSPGELLRCGATEKELCGDAGACGCEGPSRWVPCDNGDCGMDPECGDSGTDAFLFSR